MIRRFETFIMTRPVGGDELQCSPRTGACSGRQWPRLEKLVGKEALHVVRESGRKFLFTNH